VSKLRAFTSLLLIFTLIFLAACGAKEEANGDDPAPNADPGTETEDVSQVEPEEKVDLNGATIRIAQWWDGAPTGGSELGDLSVEKHKQVEEKYNVKIEYVNVPWGEVVEKMTSTALSGEPFADIVQLEFRWVPALINGGYLKALEDIVDINREEELPQSVKNMKFNGKIYGFSDSFNDTGGMFYNKTLFKREGLADPYELQQKGEWTWSAFLEAAQKLTKDTNGDGTPDQYGLSGDASLLAVYFVNSNDASIIDESMGKVTIDSPNSLEAMQFVYDIYHTYKVIKPNEGDGWGDPRRYFTEGLVGMTQGWNWEGPDRVANMSDDWGYVFWPKGPKATDYVVPISQSGFRFIPAGAKYPKESYQIWKELQLWDHVEEGFVEYNESAFPGEDAVDTAMQMRFKHKLDNYMGFGLDGDAWWALHGMIESGSEPPATAIEKSMPELQAAMDAILKK